MASTRGKFQEKRYYQPIFPSMWFNQRGLKLPDGQFHTNSVQENILRF